MEKRNRIPKQDEKDFIKELTSNTDFLKTLRHYQNAPNHYKFGEITESIKTNASIFGIKGGDEDRSKAIEEECSNAKEKKAEDASSMLENLKNIDDDVINIRDGVEESLAHYKAQETAFSIRKERLTSNIRRVYKSIVALNKLKRENN